MKVHRHAEAPAFGGNVTEEEVLERFIFCFRGRAMLRVNAFGDGTVDLVEG
jgi:hypothetical protein